MVWKKKEEVKETRFDKFIAALSTYNPIVGLIMIIIVTIVALTNNLFGFVEFRTAWWIFVGSITGIAILTMIAKDFE